MRNPDFSSVSRLKSLSVRLSLSFDRFGQGLQNDRLFSESNHLKESIQLVAHYYTIVGNLDNL